MSNPVKTGVETDRDWQCFYGHRCVWGWMWLARRVDGCLISWLVGWLLGEDVVGRGGWGGVGSSFIKGTSVMTRFRAFGTSQAHSYPSLYTFLYPIPFTYQHPESQNLRMGQVLRMVNLLMLFISFLCIFYCSKCSIVTIFYFCTICWIIE